MKFCKCYIIFHSHLLLQIGANKHGESSSGSDTSVEEYTDSEQSEANETSDGGSDAVSVTSIISEHSENVEVLPIEEALPDLNETVAAKPSKPTRKEKEKEKSIPKRKHKSKSGKLVHVEKRFDKMSRKLDNAVAAAVNLPPAPPSTEDPELESFGVVVKAGLKKFPKNRWTSIQCQVLDVFRYNEKLIEGPPRSAVPPSHTLNTSDMSFPSMQYSSVLPQSHMPVQDYQPHALPPFQHAWGPGAGYSQYTGARYNTASPGNYGGASTGINENFGNVQRPIQPIQPGSAPGYYNALTINTLNRQPSASVSTPITSQAQSAYSQPNPLVSVATGETPSEIPDLQKIDPNLSATIEDIASSMASTPDASETISSLDDSNA